MYGNVKGNLVDNIDNNFDFLLYEIGINIRVNHVNKRAIIIDNTEKPTDTDTKIIVTNFQIQQGDLIHYDNMDWLVIGEVDTSKNTYRAKMNKCNFTIKFPISGTYSFDYIVPVIPTRGSFSVENGTYINLPDGEVYVTCRADNVMNITGATTDHFGLNADFIKWSHHFKITGVDETKKGLITFHATLDALLSDASMLSESTIPTVINDININNSIDTLEIGSTYKPTATVTHNGANITDKATIYYTAVTDDTISVASDGTVTPIKAGNAILEVFSQGVYKDVSFVVKDVDYSMTILNKVENIGVNYTYALNINCYKDNVKVTNPTVTYTSSNSNVATISSDGIITGIRQGSVKITASYQNVSDTMNIDIIPINTITITNKVNQLKVGQTYTPTIVCTSNNVTDTNPTLDYTISDPNILSISNGTITVIRAGTATVVIAYKDVINSITIVCSNITYGINITNKPSSVLSNGTTLQLNVSCTQDGTADTNPSVTYTSSNTSVATVSATGLITCLNIGTVTVTASYHGVSDSIDINVVSAHDYVLSVSPTSISIENGGNATVTASVTDKGIVVSSPSFTYSSDNTAVATIDSTGKVTGVSVGSANVTIRFVGEDGNTYSKTIPVTIIAVLSKSIAITLDTTPDNDNPNKILKGDTQTYSIHETYSNGVEISDTFTIAGKVYEGTFDASYYTITMVSNNKFSVTNNKGDGTQYLLITVTSKTDTTVSGDIKIRLADEW